MTYEEFQDELGTGGLKFCPPPSDAYFAPEFVENFVRDVFGLEWRYCGSTGESRISDFVGEDDIPLLHERILRIYGIDCSNIPEQSFWLCLKRCEAAAKAFEGARREGIAD